MKRVAFQVMFGLAAASGYSANHTWTFDAGSHGKLSGTGAQSASATVAEGDKNAVVWAEVTADPGWCHIGWDPALPDSATADQTFTAVYAKDETKTVYYDSAATGTADGSSWANAYTNLREAVRSCDALRKG